MLKLILAALVLWALLTSRYRIGDVADAVTLWTIEHVQQQLTPSTSSPHPEPENGSRMFSVRSGRS